jgi:Fe-S-cluster containining protein
LSKEPEERDRAFVELIRLHRDVDREVAALEELHRDRLVCKRGCHDCCVDALTVFDVEAERIRREHPDLLRDSRPHAPGACAFLDSAGACRVYDERPYVCRTQGLPLRWIDEEAAVEMRDICPLNDRGGPIEELDRDRCWTLGPVESRLVELQRIWGRDAMERVALRSLFVDEEHRGG